MNPDFVISVLISALVTGATVMAPILAVGLTVGITIGAVQAATQVNEPTLTFVPKVIAVSVTAWMILPWGLDQYAGLFRLVIENIAEVVVR